ncbi:Nn.00g103480.m01.CDS01 [Neocucurbitaria sp. VM-36]
MSSNKPVKTTTDQAQSGISQELRNSIYSALLSEGGIRNIESTLDEQLRASGFKDELKRYITDLFRTGQATSAEEARNLAMERIREQTRPGQTNGSTNGTNGTSNGSVDGSEDYKLKIPDEAVKEGTKSVMKELEKVCDITYEDDK